jgi:hypothetical protein
MVTKERAPRVFEHEFRLGKMNWSEGKNGPELDLELQWAGLRMDKIAQIFSGVGAELLGITVRPIADDERAKDLGGRQANGDIAHPELEAWKGVGYLGARRFEPGASPDHPALAKSALRVVEADEASIGRISGLFNLRERMQRHGLATAAVTLQVYQEGLFDGDD